MPPTPEGGRRRTNSTPHPQGGRGEIGIRERKVSSRQDGERQGDTEEPNLTNQGHKQGGKERTRMTISHILEGKKSEHHYQYQLDYLSHIFKQ